MQVAEDGFVRCRWANKSFKRRAINCFCFPAPVRTASGRLHHAFRSTCLSLPSPSNKQQELLMRGEERCISAGPRWRRRLVMGRGDAALGPELITTMASNLGRSGRTIIHCPVKNKASGGRLRVDTGPTARACCASWRNGASLARLGSVMYLHYYRWRFYSPEPCEI